MKKDICEEFALAIDELAEHLRYWLGGGEFIGRPDPLVDALRRLDELRVGVGIPQPIASHCRFRKGNNGDYLSNGDWIDLESIKLSDYDRVKPYDWVHIEDIDEIARCEVLGGYKYFTVFPKTVAFQFEAGIEKRLEIAFTIGGYDFIDFVTVTNPSNFELHSMCIRALEHVDGDYSFVGGEMYHEFCHSAFVYLNSWKIRVGRFVGTELGALWSDGSHPLHQSIAPDLDQGNVALLKSHIPPMPQLPGGKNSPRLIRCFWQNANWGVEPPCCDAREICRAIWPEESRTDIESLKGNRLSRAINYLNTQFLDLDIAITFHEAGDDVTMEDYRK